MRIRKRQIPFSLLPVTFSDPNMINRSPVVVQLNDDPTTSSNLSCTHDMATALLSLSNHPQPSDQPLPPIGKPTNGSDDPIRQHKKQDFLAEDERGQVKEGGHNGNDTRKGGNLGAQISTEVFSPSSPSSYKQDWKWNEGEKTFPLKKRRGSLANSNDDDNNNKKMAKMKKKIYDSYELDEEDEDTKEEVVVKETKQKKKVRGGTLMEGSRCSRVNGRGWRCCQPTLVGYSLCEHHLGKGRLRSMTSVRNRSLAAATSSKHNMIISLNDSPPIEKQTEVDSKDNDEKKPSMIGKKRMKLGMVKARSMSSLLGQTNNDLAVAENNK
ncbi:WRC protein [Trifolium repens]|nr:WRC protein [Trifolium repens]